MADQIQVPITVGVFKRALWTLIAPYPYYQPSEHQAALIDVADIELVAAQNSDGDHTSAIDIETVQIAAGLDVDGDANDRFAVGLSRFGILIFKQFAGHDMESTRRQLK